MKNLFLSIVLLSIFLLSSYLTQAQSEQKMARVIFLIEQSEFTQKLLKDKKEIESEIANFKRKQEQLQISPEDIAEIKSNYDASKIKFDYVLNALKSDFSNKKPRKEMARNPNEYCENLMTSYNEALKFYNDGCRKKIEALIETDEGAFDPLLILTVIGISGETFRIFREIKKSNIEASMVYFERNYITGKQLKSWEVL